MELTGMELIGFAIALVPLGVLIGRSLLILRAAGEAQIEERFEYYCNR